MPFEEFDKKMREAADHHHPAYDEQAWRKMEKLLNKHLPQEKKDKRRFLLLLFLFLLVGGGMAIFLAQRSADKTPVASQNQVQPGVDRPVSDPPSLENPVSEKEILIDPKPTKTNDISGNEPILVLKGNYTSPFMKKRSNHNKILNPLADNFPGSIRPGETDIMQNQPVQQNPVLSNPLVMPDKTTRQQNPEQQVNKDINGQQKVPGADADKKTETAIDPAPNKKSNDKKRNELFLSVSAGPDVSAAGTSKPGKLKLTGGIGAGFTFKDKFTLRTGFYTGRKIYSATADDYNPPPNFWTYYPNLSKVEADCKVYEIPLQFSYRFGKKGNHNWFAGAGLSTYLMKQEIYNYHYKINGQYTTRKWTINNENDHILSVLTVSGGYQQKIGNRFSLIAEPYIKVPLTGFGYGRVRLNSTGLMLSATVRPFGKK